MKAAVLGSPITHSLSPVLHRAAYAALDLPWAYDAVEVRSGELATFLSRLDDDWRGLSLTMPLKQEVLEYLDVVDSIGQITGSVNTVVVDRGHLSGFNTDVGGIVRALRERGVVGETGSVLGTGATARSAIAAAQQLGLHSISIWGRRESAVGEMGKLAEQLGLRWENSADPDFDADVVFSTVPAGAVPATGGAGFLLDAIYDPWPPPLTIAWDEDRVASGLDLLLHQAVLQVELMTGEQAPIDAMRTALSAAVSYPHSES